MIYHALRGRTRYPGIIDTKALPFFIPSSLSNLLWWIAARKITGLSDSDTIASWSDLSDNGYHAIQATGARQPTYKTNIINGLPVARFDGGDDLIMTGLNAGSNFTWGFVYRPNATNHVGLFDSAPYQTNVVRQFTAGNVEWWDTSPMFSLGLPTTAAVYILLICELTPSRSVRYYRNGALISTNTHASTTGATWNNPRLGSINTGGAGWYTGDIAESFLYNRAITDNERAQLDLYVNMLYGLW